MIASAAGAANDLAVLLHFALRRSASVAMLAAGTAGAHTMAAIRAVLGLGMVLAC